MTNFGKVAVLMGGYSAEREVSLESGNAVITALRRRGVEVEAVDLTGDTLQQLKDGGFDRVFIALHGRGGEDGVIQGALETLRLPYTGSGVLASALAMDKSKTKRIWLSMGLPTPPFVELTAGSDTSTVVPTLGLPIMVKPAHEGSSVGAARVDKAADLPDALHEALKYDELILAERWVTGREYTVAILEGKALPMIRLQTSRRFYDYQAKYLSNDTQYICPCGLSEKQEQSLQELGLQAFHAVGAQGWGRVDLMVDAEEQPWLLEVNTVPGMTSHSLVPMAAKAQGLDFDELVMRILATSLPRQQTNAR